MSGGEAGTVTAGVSIRHSCPTAVPGAEEAVLAVLRSGQHAGGAVRAAFETALARRVGVAHGLAVQSGSAALHLALLGLGAGAGDLVLAPSYACAALLNAIDAVGARAVLVDGEPGTGSLTASVAHACRAELAHAHGTRAALRCAIVVHQFGHPAALEDWPADLPFIEDCATALGAQRAGCELGAAGRAAVFSFYATKMISTGQGGMVLTDDTRLAADLRDRVRHDGRDSWRACWNYALPDLAAALGLAQLAQLDAFLARRARLYERYRWAFADLPLGMAPEHPGDVPNRYRCVVRLPGETERDALQAALTAAGIESKPPVYQPLHRLLGLDPARFPVTEGLWASSLSLPLYPALSEDDQSRVIDTVHAFCGRLA